MTIFRKALAWTAVPIVALSVVSTAGAAYDFFYYLWFGAAGVGLLATVVLVGLYAVGRRKSGPGILYGIGIGVLALVATGALNFAMIQAGFQ